MEKDEKPDKPKKPSAMSVDDALTTVIIALRDLRPEDAVRVLRAAAVFVKAPL